MDEGREIFLSDYTKSRGHSGTPEFSQKEKLEIRKDLISVIQFAELGHYGMGYYPAWHPLGVFFSTGTLFSSIPLIDFKQLRDGRDQGISFDHVRTFNGGFFAAPYQDEFEEVKLTVDLLNAKLRKISSLRDLIYRCKRIKKAYASNAYPYLIYIESTTVPFINPSTGNVHEIFAEELIDYYFKEHEYEIYKQSKGFYASNISDDLGFPWLNEAGKMYVFYKFMRIRDKREIEVNPYREQ